MKKLSLLCSLIWLFTITLLAGCSSPVSQEIGASPVFPERHGWDLKRITISDTDTSIDFKRVDCVWVVGGDNRPSDESRVTALADKLVSMAAQGILAVDSDRYSDFRVGDENYTRKVNLVFKDDTSVTLLIGSPALTKPAYVRIAEKNMVYMVEEPMLKQISLDTGSWLVPEKGRS